MSVPSHRSRPLYRGKLGRVNQEPTNRMLRTCGPIVHRALRVLTRPDWRAGTKLPQTGPVIFTPNHISSLDPLLIGEYLIYNGRWPHFLARANLFDTWPLGALLRAGEQIPVHRGTAQAADSLRDAEKALAAGQAVVIYPEGTITFDPDEWPMAGHTGAVRLALRTGAPIVPIGQWGASRALPPRGIGKFKFRRVTTTQLCGDPIHLSEIDENDRAAVRQATVAVLDAITELVAEIRGEAAPAERWHPQQKRRVPRAEATL